MVRHPEGQIGPAQSSPGVSQHVEPVKAAVVDEVAIDPQQGGAIVAGDHGVGVPNLVEQGLSHASRFPRPGADGKRRWRRLGFGVRAACSCEMRTVTRHERWPVSCGAEGIAAAIGAGAVGLWLHRDIGVRNRGTMGADGLQCEPLPDRVPGAEKCQRLPPVREKIKKQEIIPITGGAAQFRRRLAARPAASSKKSCKFNIDATDGRLTHRVNRLH